MLRVGRDQRLNMDYRLAGGKIKKRKKRNVQFMDPRMCDSCVCVCGV